MTVIYSMLKIFKFNYFNSKIYIITNIIYIYYFWYINANK